MKPFLFGKNERDGIEDLSPNAFRLVAGGSVLTTITITGRPHDPPTSNTTRRNGGSGGGSGSADDGLDPTD
jgi:hypothetical protein